MLIKSIFTNSSGILLSRILGFIRDLLTASILGANIYSDIFFVAFKVPNLFRRIFAEGAFTQAFIPAYAKSKQKIQFSSSIFLSFFAFIMLLSLLVTLFSKFVTNFNRDVPVEVHHLARNTVAKHISKIGGRSRIRTLDRGYPFITENGNIILDCNFGVIKKPKLLQEKIKKISGVLEVGIFTRKPDIIYKAKSNGQFDIIK